MLDRRPGSLTGIGTLLCLASRAAFGAMAVFGKLAYGEGATVGTLLAVRFTLAAALFWAAGAAVRAWRARALRARTLADPEGALPGDPAAARLSRRDLLLGIGLGACG